MDAPAADAAPSAGSGGCTQIGERQLIRHSPDLVDVTTPGHSKVGASLIPCISGRPTSGSTRTGRPESQAGRPVVASARALADTAGGAVWAREVRDARSELGLRVGLDD